MGRLEKRRAGKFLANLILRIVGRMNRVDSGTISFSRGQHELFVSSRCNENIWVQLSDEGIGVCGGESVNKVGYASSDGGIVFYADVQTNSCEVKWFATRMAGRRAFDVELDEDEIAQIYGEDD